MTYVITKKQYGIGAVILVIAAVILVVYGYKNWGWFGNNKSSRLSSECPQGDCAGSSKPSCKCPDGTFSPMCCGGSVSRPIPIEVIPTRIVY